MNVIANSWRWFRGLRRRWQVVIVLAAIGAVGALIPDPPEEPKTVGAVVTASATASPTQERPAPEPRTPTPTATRTPTPVKALSDTEVCLAAHNTVKNGLKAPSTAKFPDSFCEVLIRSSTVNEAGQTVWTVKGPVDAENSFGAMLRSTYVVEITDMGDGSRYEGRLVSLE